MNQYEAGVIRTILNSANYAETKNEKDADVLLLVTCAVREHAEERALGRVQSLRALKKKDPDKIIGVLGCIAQKEQRRLITDYGVDIVAGPDEYRRLPELIKGVESEKTPLLALNLGEECYYHIYPRPENPATAFVPIMRGCNNFCSYCIVPYVRGPERSRPIDTIMEEVRHLAQTGVKEVTLLGQNVLAYHYQDKRFVDLLVRVGEINGIKRVRFLTSHPRDLNEEVIRTMKELPKVCPQIHLPLQSGSNRILELMNRGYTREEYLKKIDLLRSNIPDISLTTDIIVGFPTETEADFALTLDAVKSICFDFAYMFRFSPRHQTKAAELEPKVPVSVASRRLSQLIKVQNQITREQSQKMVGRVYEVLVEKSSPRGEGTIARTPQGKVVVLDKKLPPGSLIQVKIIGIKGWTPIGEIIQVQPETSAVGRQLEDVRN